MTLSEKIVDRLERAGCLKADRATALYAVDTAIDELIPPDLLAALAGSHKQPPAAGERFHFARPPLHMDADVDPDPPHTNPFYAAADSLRAAREEFSEWMRKMGGGR